MEIDTSPLSSTTTQMERYSRSRRVPSLQKLATLSLEKKLAPLELLIYRAMSISLNKLPSSLRRSDFLLTLISRWYEIFNVQLLIARRTGVLQSLVHYWMYQQNPEAVKIFTLCGLLFSKELLICQTFVRNTLACWPDISNLSY